MAETSVMTIGVPGVKIWIYYNSQNRRIQSVEWTIPQSGLEIQTLIKVDGLLVLDRSEIGPSTDGENVPGNHRVIWIEDANEPEGGYWDLPAYIEYQFNIQGSY